MQVTKPNPVSGRHRQYLLLTVVAVSVLAVFLQVIAFDFLKYDDTINVSENALILNPSAEILLSFWTGPFLDLYIPVTYTVWTGLAVISLYLFDGRLDPGLFHLLNLIVHLSNTILVFFIIRRLYGLKCHDLRPNAMLYGAAFGALLFGLHPVQVETVSWVTGLKGVLSAFFALSAIDLFLQWYSKNTNGCLYLAASGLFVLAVLSMPSAVIVPVMIFLMLRWVDAGSIRKSVYALLPWLVVALAAVLLTRAAQPAASVMGPYPWLIRPLIAIDAAMFYLFKIVWPQVLAIDYCRTPAYVIAQSWRNPYLLMSLPTVVLIYVFRRRMDWLWLAGAFAAAILPVSGLLPFAYQTTSTVADRYLYLPMVVVAVAAAGIPIKRPRLLVIGLCLMLAVLYGVRSYYQCRQWQDTKSIMAHTLMYYPSSFRANLNYGIGLMSNGDFKGAIPYLRAARRVKPDDPLPYYNLGVVYAATGDEKRYARQYRQLSRMDADKAAHLKYAAAVFKKMKLSDTLNKPDGTGAVSRENQP